MANFVNKMNDQGTVTPRKVSATLNAFFKKYPDYADGCIIRNDWDGYKCMLIIESSLMYSALMGEYGWGVHDDFYTSFEGTGWHPEMINSCQVGFYKDY